MQVERGDSRGRRADPGLGLGAPARPLPHAPAIRAPSALCRRSREGLGAVRGALRLSAPPAPEHTLETWEKPSQPNSASLIRCLHKQGRLPDFPPLLSCQYGCPACRRTWPRGSPGAERQPSRLRRASSADRVPKLDLRASGPPCSARPGCTLGRSLFIILSSPVCAWPFLWPLTPPLLAPDFLSQVWEGSRRPAGTPDAGPGHTLPRACVPHSLSCCGVSLPLVSPGDSSRLRPASPTLSSACAATMSPASSRSSR